jgi:hypothetical protein
MTESQGAQLLAAAAAQTDLLSAIDAAVGVLAFGLWFAIGWFVAGYAIARSEVDFAK